MTAANVANPVPSVTKKKYSWKIYLLVGVALALLSSPNFVPTLPPKDWIQAACLAWTAGCAVLLPTNCRTTWVVVGSTLTAYHVGQRWDSIALATRQTFLSSSLPKATTSSEDESSSAARTTTLHLDVQGMTCGGCGSYVRDMVLAHYGHNSVTDATVDWRAGKVTAVVQTASAAFDTDSVNALVQRITAAGYPSQVTEIVQEKV
jgi:copper chaperone CopZ